MTRKPLTTRQRVELFRAHGGMCHICKGAIHPGKAWDVEHIIPIALGGPDELPNMAPAHRECHGAKTAGQDAPAIAKAKRREAKHIGAIAPKATIPNRGFPKRDKGQRFVRAALPPRPIYEAVK